MRQIFRLILVVLIGYYVIEWWLNQQQKQTVSEVKPVTPAAKPAAKSTPAPTASKDPLVELDGIGPAYERALNDLGIHTFAQLAAQNPDDLAMRLSSVRVTSARIRRDRWIEQAAIRANIPVTSLRWSANDGNSA
jgi:predicted flap endonuclease-1-like 5' DNA nuclease